MQAKAACSAEDAIRCINKGPIRTTQTIMYVYINMYMYRERGSGLELQDFWGLDSLGEDQGAWGIARLPMPTRSPRTLLHPFRGHKSKRPDCLP